MLVYSLLLIPLLGLLLIYVNKSYSEGARYRNIYSKAMALITSTFNLVVSAIIYIIFDYSNNQFQYNHLS